MAEDNVKPCIVCEKVQPEGIYIYEQFVCTACENEIIHTDVEDIKYPFFVDRLKRIWLIHR